MYVNRFPLLCSPHQTTLPKKLKKYLNQTTDLVYFNWLAHMLGLLISLPKAIVFGHLISLLHIPQLKLMLIQVM